jgi:hypothetical protein
VCKGERRDVSDANATLDIVEVECIRVEQGKDGWNARFAARGGQRPRGLLALTRLQARPIPGRRYVLTLTEVPLT